MDNAFAMALRANFEKGLSRTRLLGFGFDFARAIWLCGGNPRPIQRTLQRAFLEDLLATDPTALLEVLPAGDPCESCEQLKGRVWTVAEALAQNPLPCKSCQCVNDGGYGWCRCEYQQRLSDELEAIVRDIQSELGGDSSRIKPASGVAYPGGDSVLTAFGVSIPIQEAAKIASDGWHYVRNRGARGVHDGCNGGLEALREAGISASTTPNRERPEFNDIVLTAVDGRSIVLMFSTSTWEFVRRRD
jgi:hypothetical protein